MYYQCYNRTSEHDALPGYQQNVFDDVTARINAHNTDAVFNPTMICVVTWIDVNPYEGLYYLDQVSSTSIWSVYKSCCARFLLDMTDLEAPR